VLEAGAEVTQHLNGKYIKTHEIEIMSQKWKTKDITTRI
jgi:hypothetical protein